MNQSFGLNHTRQQATQSGTVSGDNTTSWDRNRRFFAAVAALIACFVLLVGAVNSSAQTTNFWIGGSGDWDDGSNWSLGSPPSSTVIVAYTNAATYSINVNDSVLVKSNVFSNPNFTEADVTLNIASPNQLDTSVQLTLGDQGNSTNTVYLGSYGSGATGGFIFEAGSGITIGRNGIGTLVVTNGQFYALNCNAVLGSGSGAQGHLVISGPSSSFICSGLGIGNQTNSLGGSTLVISNSGTLYASSSFRLGSGSGGGGSSNNMVELDAGAVFITDSGPMTIGRRSSATNDVSVGNKFIVKSGALWQGGLTTSRSMCIGSLGYVPGGLNSSTPGNNMGDAWNNLLRIEQGGAVTQISTVAITPTNFLEIVGGLFAASLVTNFGGTVDAYGILRGSLVVLSNGTLIVHNSLGQLAVSNSLTVAAGSTINMELGSSFNSMFVGLSVTNGPVVGMVESNRLSLSNTWNFTDSGGFAPNTYTLINFATNGQGTNVFIKLPATIGTTPNPVYTYTIVTNILPNAPFGHVDLVVGCTNCAQSLPFQITSILRQGSDIILSWNTSGASNIVQVTSGGAGGSYSNDFVDLSPNIVITTPTTNYTDVGGAASGATRYYRVRKP